MNKIINIQDILFKEIQKLDSINDEYVLANEIQKSNAITKSATSFVKAVSTQLKVKEMSIDKQQEQTEAEILYDTGIIDTVEYQSRLDK